MNKFAKIGLVLCAAAVLAAFVWVGNGDIKHYTADELAGLTCEALGERHEEVIFAYQDAEIAHHTQTGAFHDDLGWPTEDVVPYAVLMKHFMQANGIIEANISKKAATWPILESGFYYEVSNLCAANPSWQAEGAMRQAAINLGLIDVQAKP